MRALSRKHEQALLSLLSSPSIKAAADNAGIGEATMHRYLADPAFKARYLAARRDLVEAAIATVQRGASLAVATLVDVMRDKEAPASARVTAASKMLDTAIKGIELADVEERLAEIERALQERGIRR